MQLYIMDIMNSSEKRETNLMNKVLSCKICKETDLQNIISYYPVYSFGALKNRDILVIGLSPSLKEYEEKHLKNADNISTRKMDQINYFNRTNKKYYGFFKDFEIFFNESSKTLLNINNNIWEKVGFTDLVKCPVNISFNYKDKKIKKLIGYCNTYLINQLKLYKPKIIINYGVASIEFIAGFFNEPNIRYKNFNIEYENNTIQLLNIPQTRIGVSGYNYYETELIKISIEIMLRQCYSLENDILKELIEEQDKLYSEYMRTFFDILE